MKLIVENIAKVGRAELQFNGLTVIVGDNNTGKSTIGRVLFAIFHSLYEPRAAISRLRNKLFFSFAPKLSRLRHHFAPEMLIRRSRELTVEECDSILKDLDARGRQGRDFQVVPELVDGESSRLVERTYYVHRPFLWENESERLQYAQLMLEAARSVASCTMDNILGSVVTDELRDVFSEQYRPLFGGEARSPHVRIDFREGFIEYGWNGDTSFLRSQNAAIQHDAVLVASPLLLNAASSDFGRDALEPSHRSLINKLRRPDNSETLFKEMVRSRIAPVIDVVNSHFPGNFVPSKARGGLKVDVPNLTDPLKAVNLSMGLKSFGIIKLMLERQILHDEDVLILDEPENHLHPEWQLAYAEAIVLLQREFGLTILLTTHSPFFLEAVQLYSAKYETNGEKRRLHVYEPVVLDLDGRIGMKEITHNEEALFGKFSKAFRDLDVVRAMIADPANVTRRSE